MSTEVKVPDIGDFKDVEIIEVLVKPGDTIAKEQSLITVESDKASMEIPSSVAGTVRELRVKVGNKVNQGDVILVVEAVAVREIPPAPHLQKGGGNEIPPGPPLKKGGTDPAVPPVAPPAEKGGPGDIPSSIANATQFSPPLRKGGPGGASAARHPASFTGTADLDCDVLVLGSGPGGYSAAFRAADLGKKVVLVERYAALGGVCLNVGCIPSKALLHVAAIMDEAAHFAGIGVEFGRPVVKLDKLRAHKDKVVGKLTGGLAGMAKARKVTVLRGYGSFIDPHHLEVELTVGDAQDKSGEKKVVRFAQAIIAAGSAAVRLPFIPDDPRVVDSTGALELAQVPGKMLVIGGGIIGLEMATVYSTLGARIDVVEMLDTLMTGADRDLVKVWQKYNDKRFDKLMLKTKTVAVEAKADGLWVKFEGLDGNMSAPAEPQRYDMILQAVGRSPNGRKIGAELAGVAVTDRGFIAVDKQLRTNVPHIFAIGDIVGQPMLAHKAVHEGHVAAEAAAGEKSFFDVRVIPSVAYTDPEVAWVGLTEDEAKQQGVKLKVGKFPWAASGRAIANTRDEGFTKLLFDADSHRIVGGGIVGTHAGDLISEIALAIEMGADATDIGKTIHPHPTLGESVGMAAEVAEGVCTDLPPMRK